MLGISEADPGDWGGVLGVRGVTGISALTLAVRGSNGVLWESVRIVGILKGSEGSWGIMLGGHTWGDEKI